jgi:hypothetical protein
MIGQHFFHEVCVEIVRTRSFAIREINNHKIDLCLCKLRFEVAQILRHLKEAVKAEDHCTLF